MAKINDVFILLFWCLLSFALAHPEKTEHGGASKTIGGHIKKGFHNPVFDQEALLGLHDAHELADLPDDVRVKRLTNLAKSHDANGNNIIESEELKEWILQSFGMLDREDAKEKMQEDDENGDGMVTFAEILQKQYGVSESELPGIEKAEEDSDEEDVNQLITDDKKRFTTADVNNDGSLDEEEYLAYFQPYEFPHMYDIEMERAMKDLDKDQDGAVSMYEFIGDTSDEETRLSDMTNFEELDKDKDGKLTPEELRPWALPDNSDVATEEVEHLVNMCDQDGDGHLSIEEIVKKEDEFIGSAATDYGRTLHFVKDEL